MSPGVLLAVFRCWTTTILSTYYHTLYVQEILELDVMSLSSQLIVR
jgi:hypothetical protein